jgi:hypothetical protein
LFEFAKLSLFYFFTKKNQKNNSLPFKKNGFVLHVFGN